jgi:hypothetical protein
MGIKVGGKYHADNFFKEYQTRGGMSYMDVCV